MEAKIIVSQLCDGNHETEFVAIIPYKNAEIRNERLFSPKGLTDWFFKDSFYVSKYLGYSKIVMAGSDQSKSKPAISGLPCPRWFDRFTIDEFMNLLFSR